MAMRLESLALMLARLVLVRLRVRRAWIVGAVLTGCVPSQSAVFGPVGREVQRRVGISVTRADEGPMSPAVDALLAKPLDLDAAVRIALGRNRRLQARFDELGIAASEVAEATVLPPTSVDADYKRALSGGGSEIELSVVQDILDLLQIGQRRGIAGAELRGAQARAVAATIELAAEVEIAFYEVVAREQDRELVQTAFDAASASADLVERQDEAGNTTDLALAREQEQRERARVELRRAEQLLHERRAKLGELLGVAQQQAEWTTLRRLPDLPAMRPALDDLARAAGGASLALDALQADADAAAARHRYAMIRTVIPVLGVGIAVARRDGGEWEAGPALRIGIPLFNQQQGARARARAEQRRALNELGATRNELASSSQRIRSRVVQAFDEVRQLFDVVMPLRKRVLDETVLHYNAMDASTFELLSARRDMVDVGRQYIDALRRYWLAVAEAKALRRGGNLAPSKGEAP